MEARAKNGWLAAAAVLGFTAVALGAFGAHGLRGLLHGDDAAERLAWWETAAHYHLAHALAIGLVSAAIEHGRSRALRVAGTSFGLGILIFSGTLYAMALGGPRWLGAVTPLGGTALLVGWGALCVAALRRTRS